MPKPTLYISDLDGTLLRKDSTLSLYSREKLNQLVAEGLHFSLASARSVRTIRETVGDLRLRLPIVEFGGVFLSDLATGRHEVIHEIDPSIVPELHALIVENSCFPIFSTFDGREDRVYYDSVLNSGMNDYVQNRVAARDPRLRRLDDMTDAFADHMVCVTVIEPKEKLEALAAEIDARFGETLESTLLLNVYSPDFFWLTVHDRKATKDQAIRTLMKIHDLQDSELVVFGDQTNDLAMFAVADRAVAVENAHPTLKECATEIIGTNEEDSVVRYIMRDLRGGGCKLRPPR